MDMMTSIAQMSTGMSNAKLAQGLSTAMAKKSMETTETMAQGLMKMIDSVPKFPGAKGSILDVRA
ncbi:MAG: YjfB family protein [Oscillospiraceae bacterium]|nr:YjfB family protein [Oscillospiraceae bacterium]